MPKDDTCKCVKAWHDYYKSHKEDLEAVFPLTLIQQGKCTNDEPFCKLLENGVVEYILMIWRTKYMMKNAPKKTTSIPKLVTRINGLFHEYQNIQMILERGSSEDYKMIARHLRKWCKDIALDEICNIELNENNCGDANQSENALAHHPEIVLSLAIIFQRLDDFRNCYIKAHTKNNDRFDKTTDGSAVAQCYDAMHDIFQKFVSDFCQDYSDVAWFLFENKFHMKFLSQYCSEHEVEITPLLMGASYPISNAYEIVAINYEAILDDYRMHHAGFPKLGRLLHYRDSLLNRPMDTDKVYKIHVKEAADELKKHITDKLTESVIGVVDFISKWIVDLPQSDDWEIKNYYAESYHQSDIISFSTLKNVKKFAGVCQYIEKECRDIVQYRSDTSEAIKNTMEQALKKTDIQ